MPYVERFVAEAFRPLRPGERLEEVSVKITHAALSLFVVNPSTWSANWAWSLPLIVLTVVLYVFGLLLINQKVENVENRVVERFSYPVVFVVIIGGTALFATLLHGIEGIIWAGAYRLVGALPDNRSGVLYSLNAMTSYGHANVELEQHWQLMGALEALNGMLLFGLTTAFLFGILQRVRELQSGRSR
jgi:hypothetical protein